MAPELPLSITVVIPVFRDHRQLAELLSLTRFEDAQVVVAVTAGDRDDLVPLKGRYPHATWVESDRGRARQMNAGAAAATGTWILFLHADTRLPRGWRSSVEAADRDSRISIGCFRFALDSPSIWARAIEIGVRVRVALLGLPYGDQALFVRRADFVDDGGFRDLPIMEDVDLVRRFRKRGGLFRAVHPAVTSARKWEMYGWVRQSLRNNLLIAGYYMGVPPEALKRLAERGLEGKAGRGRRHVVTFS